MRTARYAGFLAGALCLHGFAVLAGEGSSLRGLKPPSSVVEGATIVYAGSGSSTGLKARPDHTPALSLSGPFLSSGAFETRQIATADVDMRFTLHQPIGHSVAALVEPSIHTMYDALPRYTLQSQFTRTLPGGWGLGFGVRHTEFSYTTANLLSVSAERNWGNFRGAYTLYSNKGETISLGSAHRFEVSYLYGERNTIGLAYTTGRDTENIASSPAFWGNDVRDWTLSGRHWLSPNWALTYDVLGQEQGPLYRRPGLRLGVSRSF